MTERATEPKVHTMELDVGTFTKLVEGKRNWLPWRGNGVKPWDYLLCIEKDEDGEPTQRHRMLVVTDVQKSINDERPIAKGWSLLNVLMFRRPRSI